MISTAKRKKESAIMEKRSKSLYCKKETQTKSLYCKKEKKEKFVANEDMISMTKRKKNSAFMERDDLYGKKKKRLGNYEKKEKDPN
jgi:hypothetical protein